MSRFAINGKTMKAGLSWLGIAAVCFVVLELAARVDDRLTYGAPWSGPYDLDRLFQVTDRGLRGVPNGSYMTFQLNAEGLRGPAFRPDHGQVRVVAYGASETFGIYERPGNEYPRALERALNGGAGDGPFEVINAGMPGMRVGSGISLLRELGTQLAPKVVIIYPTPTHYIGVTRPYCHRPPSVPPRSDGFTFRILEKTKERVKQALPRNGMTMFRQAAIRWQMRHKTLIDQVDPRSMDAMEEDIRCALQTIKEMGATPVLVTHASRFGPVAQPDDDYYLTGWRLQYPEIEQGTLLSLEQAANDRIRAVAAGEHVDLIDASTRLGGQSALFADHAHFNDDGARQMASMLATEIRKIVPAGHVGAGS